MGAGESKGSGATLQETGNAEVGQARGQRKIEAVIDRAAGFAKTYVAVLVPCPPCSTPRPHTFTYIPISTVGPSATLRATRRCNRRGTGNAEASKVVASYEQAQSDKVVAPPSRPGSASA